MYTDKKQEIQMGRKSTQLVTCDSTGSTMNRIGQDFYFSSDICKWNALYAFSRSRNSCLASPSLSSLSALNLPSFSNQNLNFVSPSKSGGRPWHLPRQEVNFDIDGCISSIAVAPNE